MELSVYDQLRQLTAALITGGFIGIVFDIEGCLLRRRNAVRGIAYFITGILSAGIILPINVAVGLEVACTMYAFYTYFGRGDL